VPRSRLSARDSAAPTTVISSNISLLQVQHVEASYSVQPPVPRAPMPFTAEELRDPISPGGMSTSATHIFMYSPAVSWRDMEVLVPLFSWLRPVRLGSLHMICVRQKPPGRPPIIRCTLPTGGTSTAGEEGILVGRVCQCLPERL